MPVSLSAPEGVMIKLLGRTELKTRRMQRGRLVLVQISLGMYRQKNGRPCTYGVAHAHYAAVGGWVAQ
jgi:hypothetical protein